MDKYESNDNLRDFLTSINNGRGITNGGVKDFPETDITIYYDNREAPYTSEISIGHNIAGGYFYLDIHKDIIISLLHKGCFWPTKHNFNFENNCLSFNVGTKKVEIHI